MFDFPTGPTVGQVSGNYTWNGYAWMPQSSAAPIDALAYSGMQINGSMEVSQERGAVGTSLSSGVALYIVDGFVGIFAGTGAAGVQQQTSAPAGFSNSIILNCTTINSLAGANDFQWIEHRIEGYRWSRLGFGTANAQPVTISFWIYPHIAGTMAVALQSLASPYRTYVVDVPVTALSWQYKTITMPGDTTGTWRKDNTHAASIFFVFGVGSGRKTTANVWATQGTAVGTAATTNFFSAIGGPLITGVTVLPGVYAPIAAQSPLIMRPYGQELSVCQRYYYKRIYSAGNWFAALQAYSTGACSGWICTFPVTMRGAPTVTASGTFCLASSAGSQITLTTGSYATTPDFCYVSGAGAASGFVAGNAVLFGVSTAASHAFDARL